MFLLHPAATRAPVKTCLRKKENTPFEKLEMILVLLDIKKNAVAADIMVLFVPRERGHHDLVVTRKYCKTVYSLES